MTGIARCNGAPPDGPPKMTFSCRRLWSHSNAFDIYRCNFWHKGLPEAGANALISSAHRLDRFAGVRAVGMAVPAAQYSINRSSSYTGLRIVAIGER